jgi:hypothetical protein
VTSRLSARVRRLGSDRDHVGDEACPHRAVHTTLRVNDEAGVIEEGSHVVGTGMVRSDVESVGDESLQWEVLRGTQSRDRRNPARRQYSVEFPQRGGLIEEMERRGGHDCVEAAVGER